MKIVHIVLVILLVLSGCALLNRPPIVGNPHPKNGESDVPLNVFLIWNASDPDGDELTFDLYFGQSSYPPLLISNLHENSYELSELDHGRVYYWKVVVRDSRGAVVTSPIWHFRTYNSPPSVPKNPHPYDGALDVQRNVILSWSDCEDPEGDEVFYNVYMGRSPDSLNLVGNMIEDNTFDPGYLENGVTYYWKVEAVDDRGDKSSGPLWRFTVHNDPPTVPSNPSPASGSENVPRSTTLSWSCEDPEGGPLYFDVYFGDSPSPPFFKRVSTKSVNVSSLQPQRTYYWKIIAHDDKGGTSEGPIWNFRTAENSPPVSPTSPNPPDTASNQPLTLTLSWYGYDPDGDTLHYDLYFGETSLNFKARVYTTNYRLESLKPSTRYIWKVVAIDEYGLSTSGPVWTFRTTDPPYTPYNPYPANDSTVDSGNVVLRWSSSDPNGDPLKFDVYFGTSYPPPLYASNLSKNELNVGYLESGIYYWKVVAKDDKGAYTHGPVWSFKVREANNPPSMPHDPHPQNGSTVSPEIVELRWSCEDPDGDEIEYDLYFGTSFDPGFLVSGLKTPRYILEDLEPNKTYYWKVVAKDGRGGISVGPIWSFRTSEMELTEISKLHVFTGGSGEILVVDSSYGRTAYIVQKNPGVLAIVDLRDERNPRLTSSLYVGCDIDGFDYHMGYVYILCEGYLKIYDVSDPYDPILKSSIYLEMSDTNDISIDLDRVYISGSDFAILDASYPTSPWEMSRLPELGGDLKISGSVVYMSVPGYGFKLIDVSDPYNPWIISEYYTTYSGKLEISGSRLYLDTYEYLSIYDVSDPNSVSWMGGYYVGYRINDLDSYWNWIVLCTEERLEILNFSDPSDPEIIASYRMDYGYPVSADVWSDRIYVLSSDGYLVILDSSNVWRFLINNRF